MSQFSVGDIVQCSDRSSRYYKDGGTVTEVVGGMCRVDLYMSNKNVAFHDNQLIMITANKVSGAPATAKPTCGIYVGDRVEHFTGLQGTVTKVIPMSNRRDDIQVDCDDGSIRKWNSGNVVVISATKQATAAMPAHGAPYGGTCHIQIGDDVKYIGSDKKFKGAKGTVLNIYKVVTPIGPDYLAALVQVQWGNEEIPCDSLIATAPMMGSHYQAVVDSDGPKYDEDNSEKEPFRHTDLGTDLSGDELMDSIRSICGR